MRDDALAVQPATERALRKYYIAVSRSQRVKLVPWLSVLRSFNVLLKLIYGPAYKKTYKRV
jgi:hypothetical protein